MRDASVSWTEETKRCLAIGVEHGGWFVEHQDRRILDQRAARARCAGAPPPESFTPLSPMNVS